MTEFKWCSESDRVCRIIVSIATTATTEATTRHGDRANDCGLTICSVPDSYCLSGCETFYTCDRYDRCASLSSGTHTCSARCTNGSDKAGFPLRTRANNDFLTDA